MTFINKLINIIQPHFYLLTERGSRENRKKYQICFGSLNNGKHFH